MDNWLKNPWAIRFISLILAILLYVAVSISQETPSDVRTFNTNGTSETERLNDVPVDIVMDDDEEYVVSGVPETVDVNLEGSNSTITPIIRQSTLDVYADLREYGPGTHEVDLQYSGVSENVNVYMEPQTVEVTIEERATEEFSVEVDYINENQIASGYEIGEAIVEPETISVISSESQVESVAAVKAYVNMEGVDTSIDSREVTVNVYDGEGNELNVRVEPETVSVSVEILNPSKEVPIEISTTGELPEEMVLDSITAEPADVTVYASEAVLEGITQITTEPINLAQISESTEMEVNLEVPSGISSMEQEQVTVSIQLEEVGSSAFEDIEIEPVNLQENRTVTFLEEGSDVMKVTIFGREEELQRLTREDIRLSIDLGRAELGEQELPVNADVTGNLMTELEHELVTILIE